jgi:hypothetical protein
LRVLTLLRREIQVNTALKKEPNIRVLNFGSYVIKETLRRQGITMAMILSILLFFLINMGGSTLVMASPSVTLSPLHRHKVSVSTEYRLAELKEAAPPRITLLSPQGGEVWKEGETHEIRWESQGVDKVYIGVAVGGKDKGLLYSKGSSKIDAECGKISWKIPKRFITGLGPAKSDWVRVEIFDVNDHTIRDVSGYFTIECRKETVETAPSPSPRTELKSQEQDAYAEAIIHYYEAIARRQYRQAYEMLGQCKIVLYDADGSAVAFQPRDDYESWLKAHQNIDQVTIIDVKRWHRGGDLNTADHGDAEATLGIRTYEVTLDIQLREENLTIKSGWNAFLVTVVKGTDDKVRIIGIGTGP